MMHLCCVDRLKNRESGKKQREGGWCRGGRRYRFCMISSSGLA